jgi:hypothetical protein
MGIEANEPKEGKLEYRDAATAATGEMAAQMLVSSFLACGRVTTYLTATYGTWEKTKRQRNIASSINALKISNRMEGADGRLTGQACLSLHRASQRTVCLSLHRPSQCINDLASEAPHGQVR